MYIIQNCKITQKAFLIIVRIYRLIICQGHLPFQLVYLVKCKREKKKKRRRRKRKISLSLMPIGSRGRKSKVLLNSKGKAVRIL